MASTSNLFAALVGLTETPESTTDGTDEDGFIEIRCLRRLQHIFSSQSFLQAAADMSGESSNGKQPHRHRFFLSPEA